MMFRKLFAFRLRYLVLLTQLVPLQLLAASIHYELHMPNPHTHYFEVVMRVKGISTNSKLTAKDKLSLKMPVWTPGSYLIREYAKNVEQFAVKDVDGKPLSFRKTNKNTWEVAVGAYDEIQISYRVYANELTVRTSFLDADHGYVNGASMFMFIPELMHEPAELKVFPYSGWSKVSTALPQIGTNIFSVKDFDTLVDSPIEIGNHELLTFDAAGVPHEVALFSVEPLIYDKEKLLDAFRKMVEAATSVIGETPLDRYLFIIHHQPGIGGGLEHLFSSTCQTSLDAYQSDKGFKGALNLYAHEYFHLWNVKRLRPIALGPFDYENENYTHMLWVAEGFTSFYQNVILARAGILNANEVLTNLANNLNSVLNTPGNYVQPVAEASWDAWIKHYRPTENSQNATISYYSKGEMLGAILNAIIISETKAKKSLDDVMRLLYHNYYQLLGRGYTDQEFQEACETVCGKSLDTFFENSVWGTTTPDLERIFAGVGIELINLNKDKNEPYIGVNERNGSVYRINALGSAQASGLNVGDNIISVNGQVGKSLADAVAKSKVGDELEVSVLRSGVSKSFKVKVGSSKALQYEMKPMKEMNKQLEKAYSKFINI